MVRCEQFVCDDIFLHKSLKSSITEMSAIITDYNSRGSEARKNVLFQELDNNFIVIYLSRMAFTHLDT